MSDYCVVVVSEAQARFFTLEPVEFPDLESGPRLIQRGEISNPERKVRGRELYTDSKTGRGRTPAGARAHGYDDHRSQHEDEFGRRFAREVLEKATKFVQAHQARYVILAATKRMLGFLRQDLDLLVKSGIVIRKLTKDMTKFSPEQVHEHLAKEDLLPARRRAPRI